MLESINLKGKKALITGGTGAIGFSIAKILTEAGCQCVIGGTNQEKLEKNSYDIGGEYWKMDLSDISSLQAELENKDQDIDILVNNAGMTNDGLTMRMSIDAWEKVINVNLTSSFILSKYFLRKMAKKKYGKIIFITSIIALTGNAGQANYAASKAGMIGFCKSISREYAPRNININCIAPGFIESPMTDAIPEDMRASYMQSIPSKRFGTPEDVAGAALFLASTLSDYVHGTVINVNGGLYM